ncbi:glycosyltransferase [Cohnella sp.]|uniref:glycosyltransferase n=1 Tax=Cohnella sp. TaxID=1883426 RepID=UPI0035629339
MLVSVVMSTYNETEDELRKAIDSILNQTYRTLEFIIAIDNPTNVDISRILHEYKNKDSRVIILNNKENLGLAMSLNRCLDEVKGEYIARMDADDISFPDRIENELKFLCENGFDMVATDIELINEENKVLADKISYASTDTVKRILRYSNCIVHSTVMIKSEVIKSFNGYRSIKSAEDYDLWLRLLTSGYKIGIINRPLISYRLRANGILRSDKFGQHLSTQYVKQLYKFRKNKKNIDPFSEEDMKAYLEEHGYFNVEYKRKYEKCCNLYVIAKEDIETHKFIRGYWKLIKSMCLHKDRRLLAINIIHRKIMSIYIQYVH